MFEAGRRCPTGEAIFAFRLSRGADLVRLLENIKKSPSDSPNEHHYRDDDFLLNCRLSRLNSPQQSDRFFNNQHVPQSMHGEGHEITKQRKKDASTSTDNQAIDHPNSLINGDPEDPRPLSYVMIDFDTTKALNESAQAHAASRVR